MTNYQLIAIEDHSNSFTTTFTTETIHVSLSFSIVEINLTARPLNRITSDFLKSKLKVFVHYPYYTITVIGAKQANYSNYPLNWTLKSIICKVHFYLFSKWPYSGMFWLGRCLEGTGRVRTYPNHQNPLRISRSTSTFICSIIFR